MRHAIRDSKGRFAKAQQALLAPEEYTKESLLRTFLQAAAVILLALIGACMLTTLLLIATS